METPHHRFQCTKKYIANFEGKILLLQKDFIFAESEHSAMIKIVSRNFSTKSVKRILVHIEN